MLIYLIHVLSDIHQPMHTCNLINGEFPNGDKGGNQFIVNFKGRSTNLHWLWDSAIGMLDEKEFVITSSLSQLSIRRSLG